MRNKYLRQRRNKMIVITEKNYDQKVLLKTWDGFHLRVLCWIQQIILRFHPSICKSFLKVLSMFNISILHDEIIVQKNIPYYVVMMCINSVKAVGCSLENQTIEKFITFFVRNMVFRNVGLSLVVQSKKILSFYFNHYWSSWILNVPWYNATLLIHSRINQYLNIMLQLPDVTNII